MKKTSKSAPSYVPFERCVLRTPLFPLGALGDPEALLRTPQMQEALYVASPDLYGCRHDDDETTRISLRKYVHRSSTRCTPFGLFAGCTVGRVGDGNVTRFVTMDGHRKTARLDTVCLCDLVACLEGIPEVRNNLRYYPNETLYRMIGQVRYVENLKGKYSNESVVCSVRSTAYLAKALKIAASGATIGRIAQGLSWNGVTAEEAREYVCELVQSQILKSELQAHSVGEDNLKALLCKTDRLPRHPLFDDIREIQATLDRINSTAIGGSISDYRHIAAIMDRIGIEYKKKRLLQVDLHKKAEKFEVDRELVAQLTRAVNALMETGGTKQNLRTFAQRFYSKYEGKPTPLSTVLDKELGIGYPEPAVATGSSELLDDLAIPAKYGWGSGGGSYSPQDMLMLEKYLDAMAKGETTIRIDDMIPDNAPARPLSDFGPITIAATCNLLRDGDGSDVLFLHGFGGSCAANMLGRFSHLDGEFEDFVREITDYEASFWKDRMFVEISYLPNGVVGNIAARPQIRDYVFHYVSNGNGNQRNVPLSDIMVTLENGRVALYSKKYKKQLIPRLTCAHGYTQSKVPVYRLLGDLQVQDNIWSFGWGTIFSQLRYSPRLQYKNIILSRQRWTVDASELEGCERMDDAQLKDFFDEFMQKHRMSRHVVYAQWDNEMYIDLLDAASIKILLSLVKGQPYFSLEEFLFAGDSSGVRDGEDAYANEIVFCFKKTKTDE